MNCLYPNEIIEEDFRHNSWISQLRNPEWRMDQVMDAIYGVLKMDGDVPSIEDIRKRMFDRSTAWSKYGNTFSVELTRDGSIRVGKGANQADDGAYRSEDGKRALFVASGIAIGYELYNSTSYSVVHAMNGMLISHANTTSLPWRRKAGFNAHVKPNKITSNYSSIPLLIFAGACQHVHRHFCAINGTRVHHTTGNLMISGARFEREEYLKRIIRDFLPSTRIVPNERLPEIQKLEFDIWIPDLKLAIEYQGEQHFKVVRGDEQTLAEQQERDRRKVRLAKDNNYTLVEFRFDEKLTPELVGARIVSARPDLKSMFNYRTAILE